MTTKTAQFTPGPWFYNYDDRCITNQDGVTVINVHGAMSGDNTNADIAMLAAAPAMYEALQALLALIGDEDLPDNGELSGASICDFARSALAQAEGRQA